jgi:phage N-6-adenine-methyltransferase
VWRLNGSCERAHHRAALKFALSAARPADKKCMTKPVNENQADSERLAYVGGVQGARKSNEWYTPEKYLLSVRNVLGFIDLDPFSSNVANLTVQANRFYTESDDAFTQQWTAETVWMNPPYSGGLVAQATNKFMDEFGKNAFSAGIILVNNATETRWFQRAFRESSAVCFTHHRIAYATPDSKRVSGNTRGQAFLLFGDHVRSAFREQFTSHGHVLFTH